jgi:hypothetical protein
MGLAHIYNSVLQPTLAMSTPDLPSIGNEHRSESGLYICLGLLGPFAAVAIVFMCCSSISGGPRVFRRERGGTIIWDGIRASVVEEEGLKKPELWEAMIHGHDGENNVLWCMMKVIIFSHAILSDVKLMIIVTKPLAATCLRISPQVAFSSIPLNTQRDLLRPKQHVEIYHAREDVYSQPDAVQILVIIAMPSPRSEETSQHVGEHLIGVKRLPWATVANERSPGAGETV